MTRLSLPRLDTASLINRFSQALAEPPPPPLALGSAAPPPTALLRSPTAPEALAIKTDYRLSDFTGYHDSDFIRNAYRGVLGREPDPDGMANYLHRLRSGELGKPEIIARLRYSPEGRRRGIAIAGLWPHAVMVALGGIPAVGFGVRWLAALLQLPLLLRHRRAFEAHSHCQERQRDALFDAQAERIEAALLRLQGELSRQEAALLGELQRQGEALDELRQAQQRALAEVQQRLQQAQEQHQEGVAATLERLTVQLTQLELGKADRGQVGEQLTLLQRQLQHQSQLQQADETRLMEFVQAMEPFKQQIWQFNDEVNRYISKAQGQAEQLANDQRGLADQQRHLDQRSQEQQRQFWGLEQAQAALREEFQQQRAALSGFASELQEGRLQLTDQRRQLLDLQASTAGSAGVGAALALAGAAPAGSEPAGVDEHGLLDSVYVTFEDQFRGDRAAIKENQRLYLDYLTKVAGEEGLVIDIGCGRGEWLELLAEAGYRGRGVDSNRAMIRECQALGLDGVVGDAVAFLTKQPPQSAIAVTGFHIVEHLPFATLVRLLDAARRVLKPEGVAIFETPNPENLVVSGYTFYFDPTHRHPLPPPVLRHLALMRGFGDVEILRRHPRSEESGDASLTKWLCAPVDYAIIAHL